MTMARGMNRMIKQVVVWIWILTLVSPSSAQELTIVEKPCTCGEHFKYYGQWGWCVCEEVYCDKDGNCICVKPCEENK